MNRPLQAGHDPFSDGFGAFRTSGNTSASYQIPAKHYAQLCAIERGFRGRRVCTFMGYSRGYIR